MLVMFINLILFVKYQQIKFLYLIHIIFAEYYYNLNYINFIGVYIGWGNHLICNKKYHFLLPSKEALSSCTSCENCCDSVGTMNNGKSKLIELEGHMMHGVFHSNGFGHLLCVNGLEMGSNLGGNQIMEFWNRLCNGLQARLVHFHTLLIMNAL